MLGAGVAPVHPDLSRRPGCKGGAMMQYLFQSINFGGPGLAGAQGALPVDSAIGATWCPGT
ncbi:hypothetical protein GCM10009777_29050 [Microbacterium pumilum]|uniref:Uncharacterized protein n=1 Tax=Microbacterium pumilum TaxID=344165 RepID=A0ABP5EA03_9MICO